MTKAQKQEHEERDLTPSPVPTKEKPWRVTYPGMFGTTVVRCFITAGRAAQWAQRVGKLGTPGTIIDFVESEASNE